MAEPAQPAWYEELLQRHYRPLVAFVRGLLSDAELAQDVAQEVFIAAWRAAQQQKPPFMAVLDAEGARRWLFRVAYRRAISARRHASVITWEPLDELDTPASTGTPPPGFEDRIAEGEALAAALAHLSGLDAACVLLHIVHGFTAAEVAQIIEVSPEAAKKRLWRATERLRAAYFVAEETPAGRQGRQ